MKDILKGELVHLSAIDPEEIGKSFATWNRDSEYKRLIDLTSPRLSSVKAMKEWFEKELKDTGDKTFWFTIRAVEDDRLLGEIAIDVINWGARDSFVGLGIGERDFWGRGYGTEAMQLILQFGFTEVNLRRVTLTVFEYNTRAIRSYEKVGFQHEGRQRGRILREGKRWDVLFMSILQDEWKDKYEH